MDENDLLCALRAGRQQGRRGWRCAEEAALAAYADHRLAASEKARIEAHLATCDFCIEQVAFLARLRDTEAPADVPPELLVRARELPAKKSSGGWTPEWRWGAAVAALAGVAAVSTYSLRQQTAGPTVLSELPKVVLPAPLVPAPDREPAATEQARTVRSATAAELSPELLFPAEGGVIAATDREIRWRPVARALFYEVHLMTAEGDLVWETRTDRTAASVPVAHLNAGRKYYLSVRALLPEGKTIKSTTVGFEVQGK
jgi:hypothetical protein